MPVHRIDFGLQPVDLALHDAKRVFVLFEIGVAEIGPEIEQIVLDAGQHRRRLARGMETRQTDGRVGFVDGAIGADPRIVLGDAGAAAQRGLSAIAAACVDSAELDHQ